MNFFTLFDIEIDGQESYGGELQYLQRWEYANFVVGGGYFDVDRKDDIALEFDFPPVFSR